MCAQIIRGHPLRADAAQRRVPGVHVRVDQAGHDDLVAGVDGLVGGRAEIAAHRFDAVAAQQKLAGFAEVAHDRVERNQPAAPYQHTFHMRVLVPAVE